MCTRAAPVNEKIKTISIYEQPEKGKKEKKRQHARFVRASTDNGARAIPKCSNSNTQRLRSESFEPAAVLSSVLQRIGIGCGWASNVSRRAASRSACSFESAGTLSAAVSACSGSIDAMDGYCYCGCRERRCPALRCSLRLVAGIDCKAPAQGRDERRSVRLFFCFLSIFFSSF